MGWGSFTRGVTNSVKNAVSGATSEATHIVESPVAQFKRAVDQVRESPVKSARSVLKLGKGAGWNGSKGAVFLNNKVR